MIAMMKYDHVLNIDREVCRGETLQEVIEKFETMPKSSNYNYWLKIMPSVRDTGQPAQGTYKG